MPLFQLRHCSRQQEWTSCPLPGTPALVGGDVTPDRARKEVALGNSGRGYTHRQPAQTLKVQEEDSWPKASIGKQFHPPGDSTAWQPSANSDALDPLNFGAIDIAFCTAV